MSPGKNERVNITVYLNKSTCRLILHLTDFTGNMFDQQVVQDFYTAVIPAITAQITFVDEQYDEIKESWENILYSSV